MSKRISIFSFKRLFSSSNCTFLFLRCCSSLPDTFPPDSGLNKSRKKTWINVELVAWQMQQYMQDEMGRFSVLTCYPLSIFKFPALASNIHHRRSIFEAQLHFSRWTIQLKIQDKNNSSFFLHVIFLRKSFKPSSCVYFLKMFACNIILKLGNILMDIFLFKWICQKEKKTSIWTHCVKAGQRRGFARWNLLRAESVSEKRHL